MAQLRVWYSATDYFLLSVHLHFCSRAQHHHGLLPQYWHNLSMSITCQKPVTFRCKQEDLLKFQLRYKVLKETWFGCQCWTGWKVLYRKICMNLTDLLLLLQFPLLSRFSINYMIIFILFYFLFFIYFWVIVQAQEKGWWMPIRIWVTISSKTEVEMIHEKYSTLFLPVLRVFIFWILISMWKEMIKSTLKVL